jgi:NADH-quinone oxidoreductase subunit M
VAVRRTRAALRGFNWALGIDGIALMLIVLSVFLMPICIGASWRSIEQARGEYMAAFLFMETLMIGVFAAQDLFLFYIFFEAGLIPMYLIIGIWGGAEPDLRQLQVLPLHAARLGADADRDAVDGQRGGTTDIPTLMAYDFPPGAQTWLWLAFFASFAVKMPMWPVHTWLPDAHVQAPTAGSVILAGVLLKMGGYGFIRFSLPMFPEARQFVPLMFGCRWPRWSTPADRAGAARHEEADRLFLGRAHGDRHRRPVRLQRAGARRRDDRHAQPRPRLGRAVPVRGRDLRPAAHARDRPLRRPRSTCRITRCCSCCSPWPAVGLPGTSGFVGEFLSLAGIYQVSTWVTRSAPPGSSWARPTCSTSTGGGVRRAAQRRCGGDARP